MRLFTFVVVMSVLVAGVASAKPPLLRGHLAGVTPKSCGLPSPPSHANRRLACFHLLQWNFEGVSNTFSIGRVSL